MRRIKLALDMDGVITANPTALEWLTYHLSKNENSFDIYIVTWRNGSDEDRVFETYEDLRRFNISYKELIMAPQKFFKARDAAEWKLSKIKELGINIWVDDELKSYKRDYGIDLDVELPEVIKIWI